MGLSTLERHEFLARCLPQLARKLGEHPRLLPRDPLPRGQLRAAWISILYRGETPRDEGIQDPHWPIRPPSLPGLGARSLWLSEAILPSRGHLSQIERSYGREDCVDSKDNNRVRTRLNQLRLQAWQECPSPGYLRVYSRGFRRLSAGIRRFDEVLCLACNSPGRMCATIERFCQLIHPCSFPQILRVISASRRDLDKVGSDKPSVARRSAISSSVSACRS